MQIKQNMTDERFEFTASLKKKLIIIGLVAVVLFVIGVIAAMSGGDHEAASHGAEAAGHAADTGDHGGGEHGNTWLKRIYANPLDQ